MAAAGLAWPCRVAADWDSAGVAEACRKQAKCPADLEVEKDEKNMEEGSINVDGMI